MRDCKQAPRKQYALLVIPEPEFGYTGITTARMSVLRGAVIEEPGQLRELAAFLRARRARLTPEAVGLPRGARRRTPGLRREEVAEIAGLGPTWYTWLEQGRDIHPSAATLERLARALRLDAAERRYLFLLAGYPPPAVLPEGEETVGPALRRVLDALGDTPAYVLGRYWDRLAWNRAAELIFDLAAAPPHGRNLLWQLFTDPAHRDFVVEWEAVARGVLAEFRADSAAAPDDPRFTALIADLQRSSPEFRAWWPQHDVRGIVGGRKVFAHPDVGHLVLEHTTLLVPGHVGERLMIYTPLPEADTAAKLQRLLTADPVGTR